MARTTRLPGDLGVNPTVDTVRERCKKSLFWTAWYLCGYRDLSLVLHYALASAFQKKLVEGRRHLTLVPRGHFKTSLLSIAFILWLLINDPNRRILLIMHNLDEAKRKGRKLKAIMRGKAMMAYFPELIPKDKAKLGTTTEWSVIRAEEFPEESVTLAGVATGITGGHYDFIIIDDGVDFKAANSEATMQMAVEYLESIDPLFENEESRLIVTGTLWPGGEAGFYERLLKNPKFSKIVLGCYIDDRFLEFLQQAGVRLPGADYTEKRILPANREKAWQLGQPIFPEWRTMEGLEETKAQMGSYKFAHQMLNILLDESRRRFKRDDFLPYQLQFDSVGRPAAVWLDKVAYPWSRGIISVSMDPTGGMNKDSDFCGITACYWYPPQRFACLLDYFHSNGVDPKAQIEKFLDMAEKWDADVLIPESGSMQVWVGAWLRDAMTARRKLYRVHEYKTRGVTKGRRILDGFHPYVAGHQFYVLYPEHLEVVDHMVALNVAPDGTILGDSPALADSLVMHIDFWRPGSERRISNMTEVRDEDEFENARRKRQSHVRYGLYRRVGRGGA